MIDVIVRSQGLEHSAVRPIHRKHVRSRECICCPDAGIRMSAFLAFSGTMEPRPAGGSISLAAARGSLASIPDLNRDLCSRNIPRYPRPKLR
jgi:hypothetical protein